MFVVYHIRSTMQVGPIRSTMQVGPTPSGWPHTDYAKTYKTAHHAKQACDKLNARAIGYGYGPGPYGWCSADHYSKSVVRMVERVNLLSGRKYVEPSNTPNYCSPSSEAYWSM